MNLGNLGKRELAALDLLPDGERREAILTRIKAWMQEKGTNDDAK